MAHSSRTIPSRARTEFLLIVLLLMVVSASSAVALTWNSSGSPLTVTGYGSTGRAYGTWGVTNGTSGTKFTTVSQQKVANADNHTVYVTTENWVNAGLCFSPDYTSCQQAYYYYNGSSTAHTNSASYVQRTSTASVAPSADFGRGYLRVKLDVPWRVDPSSGATVTKGVKY